LIAPSGNLQRPSRSVSKGIPFRLWSASRSLISTLPSSAARPAPRRFRRRKSRRPPPARRRRQRRVKGLFRFARPHCGADDHGFFGRPPLCEAAPPFFPAVAASSWSREKERFEGWTALPPFCPALAARAALCAKLRFSAGTLLPPLLAISRCFSGLIEANPRLLFGFCCLSTMCAPHSRTVLSYAESKTIGKLRRKSAKIIVKLIGPRLALVQISS
jgi:hypothetical protein